MDKSLTIKTLGEFVKSVKRGLSRYVQKEGVEVKFINTTDVKYGRVDVSSVRTVHVNDYAYVLDRARLEPGDVIVCVKGLSFKAALADESCQGFVLSSNLLALKLKEGIFPEIVVGYLNGSKGQKELNARAAGSSMKALNKKSLMAVKLPFPDAKRQESLVEYLALSERYDRLLREEQDLRKKFNECIIELR